jgi:fatty-acyl-CoA synthase/benzoate-CoA ligase/fatty acid CoA ligase FadD22
VPAGRHNLSVGLLDERLARGDGPRPALRAGGAEWTYADLAGAAGSAAAWLVEEGVGRGDLVLLALPDGPEWVALFLGACRVGAACALASPALPAGRLHEAAARLRPRAAIVEAPWPAALGRWLPASAARSAMSSGLPDPGPTHLRGDEPAHLLLTSGSTGPAKWAVHRVRDIAACTATYGRRVLRLRPDDATWSVAALATSYGLGNSCYFPLAAGACAVLAGADRSPAACAAACREQGVSVLFGVPTFWARLARHATDGRVAAGDLAGVRLAVSAGEHLPGELWCAVRRATGLRLVNGLGSSEATNLFLSDRPGGARPGTVGHVVPGYAVRIRPEEGDGPGQGELLVRGPTVMAGYHGDPAATARALEDGWLATGDRVRRERDGSHTYLGRRGERFKAGALWVDAARVAEALRGHADVAEVAVVPVEDVDGLLRVGAAVVARPGASDRLDDELAAVAAEHLAAHERPRALLILAALPTTSSGKVDRADLRRRLAPAITSPPSPRRTVP